MNILPLRWWLICCGLGVALGTVMILSHLGPGLKPPVPRNTPSYRNTVRQAYLNQLAGALTRYLTDYHQLPDTLASTDTQICSSSGPNCSMMRLADLNFLVSSSIYIQNIPTDPNGSETRWGTNFTIAQLPDGRLRLRAPGAELGADITVVTK